MLPKGTALVRACALLETGAFCAMPSAISQQVLIQLSDEWRVRPLDHLQWVLERRAVRGGGRWKHRASHLNDGGSVLDAWAYCHTKAGLRTAVRRSKSQWRGGLKMWRADEAGNVKIVRAETNISEAHPGIPERGKADLRRLRKLCRDATGETAGVISDPSLTQEAAE